MPPYITFPQLNFRFNNDPRNDMTNIDPRVNAFSWAPMPNAPQTLLAYITSFGVINTSTNTGTGNWSTGFDTLTYRSSPINNNAYFTTTNRVNVIQGDGSNDANDWVVFNFGPRVVDYDGQRNSQARYFGGENSVGGATSSGGRGLGGTSVINSTTSAVVTTGQIYGFGNNSWQLLYELPLGGAAGFNHSNANWWNAGTIVTVGNGKRANYDTYPITAVGFGVF